VCPEGIVGRLQGLISAILEEGSGIFLNWASEENLSVTCDDIDEEDTLHDL